VELPDGEVAELEAEVGRDVGVGHLLHGQVDIQADRSCADLEGPAVGGLHQAGAAAGHDHVLRLPVGRLLALAGDDRGELPGQIVVPALGGQPFGPPDGPLTPNILGRVGQAGLGPLQVRGSLGRVHDPRAAEHHDGRADVVILEDHLGLKQLQLDPIGPHLGSCQEINVLVGQPVGQGVQDLLDPFLAFSVVHRRTPGIRGR